MHIRHLAQSLAHGKHSRNVCYCYVKIEGKKEVFYEVLFF